jgi:tripartite ATP-independent transporter DctM subunit
VDWPLILILLVGGLIFLMAMGLPVAFCFMFVNLVGVYWFWGGLSGLEQLIHTIFESLSSFTLLPLPLFVLMGEVMFLSGIAPNMIDALDKWFGRIPGRLSLLVVGAGTIFSTLSGASMASVARLGSTLAPEMEKRGYKKPMSLGPILGSGGLAIMIPPSILAVLLGAIGRISVGKILIAIIVPGLLMAVLYTIYIVGRCMLQPAIAPTYEVKVPRFTERLLATAKYILPLSLILFLVIGMMLIGVATPSEAAALGSIGCFFLAFVYRRLTWDLLKNSIANTIKVTVMIFIIIAGALAFAQVLAFSGASRGLIKFTLSLPLTPLLIIVAMQVILLILGTFMDVVAMMLITLPLYMPVIKVLGFDPVWFAVIMLLNVEMADVSPPFGLGLFVMKGVAPKGTTMADIYKAVLPFLACDLVAMILIIFFPPIALWLPSLMR